jgi:hypothetical protein
MGNAKSIDILVRTASNRLREISVKAICGGGKWGVGSDDVSRRSSLFFVLLHYTSFEDPAVIPEVFVIPACDVETIKRPWIDGSAIYCTNARHRKRIEPYRNAWKLIA